MGRLVFTKQRVRNRRQRRSALARWAAGFGEYERQCPVRHESLTNSWLPVQARSHKSSFQSSGRIRVGPRPDEVWFLRELAWSSVQVNVACSCLARHDASQFASEARLRIRFGNLSEYRFPH
jgi:hypothetical protein